MVWGLRFLLLLIAIPLTTMADPPNERDDIERAIEAASALQGAVPFNPVNIGPRWADLETMKKLRRLRSVLGEDIFEKPPKGKSVLDALRAKQEKLRKRKSEASESYAILGAIDANTPKDKIPEAVSKYVRDWKKRAQKIQDKKMDRLMQELVELPRDELLIGALDARQKLREIQDSVANHNKMLLYMESREAEILEGLRSNNNDLEKLKAALKLEMFGGSEAKLRALDELMLLFEELNKQIEGKTDNIGKLGNQTRPFFGNANFREFVRQLNGRLQPIRRNIGLNAAPDSFYEDVRGQEKGDWEVFVEQLKLIDNLRKTEESLARQLQEYRRETPRVGPAGSPFGPVPPFGAQPGVHRN